MPRSGLIALAASLAAALVTGCATYKQDLDRAQRHYGDHQFEQSLALLRVLEGDLDSLSASDRAEYAYLRGMNDYRLAGLAPEGSSVTSPRGGFRDNARHWLGIAAAREKETPGSIQGDEKKRLDDALAELNRDVYGGADAPGTEPEAEKKAEPDAGKRAEPGSMPSGFQTAPRPR